jgi:hypothetical protein
LRFKKIYEFKISADPCVGAALDRLNPNTVIMSSKPFLSIYVYNIKCITMNIHLYTDNKQKSGGRRSK